MDETIAGTGSFRYLERALKQSITVQEARSIILSTVQPVGAEKVSLSASLGRVLTETAASPWDIPPLDNSAMDGYAVRASDLGGAIPEQPVRLKVLEELPAGRIATQKVIPGTSRKSMPFRASSASLSKSNPGAVRST